MKLTVRWWRLDGSGIRVSMDSNCLLFTFRCDGVTGGRGWEEASGIAWCFSFLLVCCASLPRYIISMLALSYFSYYARAFPRTPRLEDHHLRRHPDSFTEDYIRRIRPRTAIRSRNRTTGTRPMGATKSNSGGSQPCRHRRQREGRRVGKDGSTERTRLRTTALRVQHHVSGPPEARYHRAEVDRGWSHA